MKRGPISIEVIGTFYAAHFMWAGLYLTLSKVMLCISLIYLVLTVWQNTTSLRYCSDKLMAIVGALSCISRNTMDFLALSLIMATHSFRVVRRGYRASLHSPRAINHTANIRNRHKTGQPTYIVADGKHDLHWEAYQERSPQHWDYLK